MMACENNGKFNFLLSASFFDIRLILIIIINFSDSILAIFVSSSR